MATHIDVNDPRAAQDGATDQRRDDKAHFLAQNAGQWIKVRTRDGKPLAFAIASATRPGLFHLANTRRCSCEDSQRGHWCYHSRACRIHVDRVKAAKASA